MGNCCYLASGATPAAVPVTVEACQEPDGTFGKVSGERLGKEDFVEVWAG